MPRKLNLGILVPRAHFVGEFVLVVLGVLVALMVDSWIAGRNDEALREEYLSRLADDVRADIQSLDYRIEFFGDVKNFGLQTLDRLRSSDPVEPDAIIAAFYSAETYPFTTTDHTNTDLHSTGNVRLLRDIGLRTSLSEYYVQIDTTSDILDEDYRKVVRGIIPYHLQESIRQQCPTTAGVEQIPTGFPPCELADIDPGEVDAIFDAIRAHAGMRELLTYRVSQIDAALMLYGALRQAALELLESLEDAT